MTDLDGCVDTRGFRAHTVYLIALGGVETWHLHGDA